jgi:hypothetical protein
MRTKTNREKNNYFIYDLGVPKRWNSGPDFIKNIIQKIFSHEIFNQKFILHTMFHVNLHITIAENRIYV